MVVQSKEILHQHMLKVYLKLLSEGRPPFCKKDEFLEKFLAIEKEIVDQSEVGDIKYNIMVEAGKWERALEALESVQGRDDWVLSEKAWISYTYMDQIAKNEEDRKQLIESATNMLQDAITKNAANLNARIRLGTLLHITNKSDNKT